MFVCTAGGGSTMAMPDVCKTPAPPAPPIPPPPVPESVAPANPAEPDPVVITHRLTVHPVWPFVYSPYTDLPLLLYVPTAPAGRTLTVRSFKEKLFPNGVIPI